MSRYLVWCTVSVKQQLFTGLHQTWGTDWTHVSLKAVDISNTLYNTFFFIFLFQYIFYEQNMCRVTFRSECSNDYRTTCMFHGHRKVVQQCNKTVESQPIKTVQLTAQWRQKRCTGKVDPSDEGKVVVVVMSSCGLDACSLVMASVVTLYRVVRNHTVLSVYWLCSITSPPPQKKRAKENSQSILVASWSPQHKRNIYRGKAKGCNDEHCELEIVAEHIAHMV